MNDNNAVSPRYVGIDLHKHLVVFCLIDVAGKVILRHHCDCSREALVQFAQQNLRPTDQIALEATTNTWQVVSILKPFVAAVVVSNPLKTKAIAEAKVKTDKVDALVLAQLLRCDFLPRVWEPSAETQQLRRLTGRRAALVMDASAVKNRIHSVLHQRLIKCPCKDIFGPQGRQWLKTVSLDDEGRSAVESDLRLLDNLETEIARQEETLITKAYGDARVKILMTLPGISQTVALALLAALGDASRFRDGDHAASYLGLVPSTRQSANHCYHGPITKQGHRHTRGLLVQAAQHLTEHPGPLGAFFRRVMKRKGRNIAVVATARKLVVIAWQMLRDNEPYRYAQPTTAQQKLDQLRVKATGEKRRCGFAKGTPRHEHWGKGISVRKVPSLAQVYERAGLPVPKELTALSAGELRVLEETETLSFAASIRQEKQVVREIRKDSKRGGSSPGSNST